MEKQNSVAKVLRIIGIAIMIGGFFFAIIISSGAPGGLFWSSFLTGLFSSFTTGMLFVGFSEVIALLQKIYDRLHDDKSETAASSSNEPMGVKPQERKSWQPSSHDLEDIQELYHDRKITEIKATPYEDYCVVQLEREDHIEVVELGGFKPKKVSAESEPELVKNLQEWFDNLPSS